MPSVTSLLKTAQATQRKIAEQQDAQVAYDYSLSSKTYDDFVEYSKYLDSRRQVYNGDPSKLLTLDKTINAARKAYVSNEIQRQNINIIEGRGDNASKYQKMVELFYQAIDNGDYDQAQTLNLQLDNLSVKMQNEAIAQNEAQMRAFTSAKAAGEKTVSNLIDKLQKGVDYVDLGDGNVVKPLAMISDEIKKTGGGSLASGQQDNVFLAARETLDAIRNLVIDQYNAADTQDAVDKLEQKYGAGLANIDQVVTFDFGGKKLSAQDLETAYQNDLINNPVYSLKATYNEATGKSTYKLQENNVDRLEYTRQIDPQTGEEYYAPTTVRTSQDKLYFGNDQGRGLGTQITDTGAVIGSTGSIRGGESVVNRDPSQSIENRLKNLGIEAKQNGTTLQIKLPGDIERTATIQPDGSIRYFDDNGQLLEFGLVDRQLGLDGNPNTVFRAGEQRVVDPSEVSDFGQASAFGTGQISRASQQGQRYLEAFRGNLPQLSPQDLRSNRPISLANNFSGFGAPVTSGLLQNSQFTQRNIAQEEKAKQILLQAQQDQQQLLQQSQVFNLNQTPVQQLAAGGILKKQLSVAPLPAQPRITVAPPAAPKPITSVGVSTTPKKNISVGVSRPGTLTIPGLSF